VSKNKLLKEIGEFRALEEVIFPLEKKYCNFESSGDDCSFVKISCDLLAVTADVGPRPLVQSLDFYSDDYEAAGWHAVVATASDLASAGALPLFLTNCIDAPPELPVSTLHEFMEGYFRACASFGFNNAGGDIRHGAELKARVFGVGEVQNNRPIGRGGVEEGDQLVLIGHAGRFIANYLLARENHPSVVNVSGELIGEAESILRFPRVQLKSMLELTGQCLVGAASDSSDGLLGAIENLSRASRCGFELSLDSELLSPVVRTAAKLTGYDPWNIFCCWGDWSVVATVKPGKFIQFKDFCAIKNIDWSHLGRAISKAKKIIGLKDGSSVPINVVRNENFFDHGFNANLESHLDQMMLTNLFEKAEDQ